VDGITQEIFPVQVVNVHVVRIEPAHRPRLNHVEPITAVLKTSRPVGEFRTVHMKPVATAKTGTELSFGNAPMARGWRGFPAGPLLFLTALRLLYRPSLLLTHRAFRLLYRPGLLLMLGLLWLLYRPSLLLMLGLLWLLYRPSLLGLSWLLCRFRLLLALCGLVLLLLLLWLLLPLVFLSVDGNNGCGKQEQDCRS